MGLSFFNTALVSFHFWFVGRLILLPCHCIASAMYYLTVRTGPPLGLPCIFPLLSSHCLVFSVGLILISSWASLAHFIPLGILDPLHSFWNPWPIPFLHSHGLLLNLSGFFGPITISLTFGVCWPLHQPHLLIPFFGLLRPIFTCFLFLMILMVLLLPSLSSLGPICFSWGLFYYFIGLWTIIPTIQV